VDLLAVVPCLLGFHPTDSLVVVAMRGGLMIFAARGDLPADRASGASVTAIADQFAQVVARQGVQAAAVIGYGPADRVAAAAPALCAALAEHGLQIFDVLRVTAGRYWSLLCADPECCPPDGSAFDVATSSLTAEAVFAGQVVLPDRSALARTVAPIGGPARESMRQATERAMDRVATLLTAEPVTASPAAARPGTAEPATAGPGTAEPAGALPAGTGPPALLRSAGEIAVLRAGKAAVREALARGETGSRLTDDEVGWLTLLLAHQPVRDFAWQRTTPDGWQIALWTDVLRRAEPDLAAAPASLLAFAAWRLGHGALASVALERALGADPRYPMALLLDDVLRRGMAPSILDGWPAGPGRRRRRRRLRGTAGDRDATG
jgi:hypothetical protein